MTFKRIRKKSVSLLIILTISVGMTVTNIVPTLGVWMLDLQLFTFKATDVYFFDKGGVEKVVTFTCLPDEDYAKKLYVLGNPKYDSIGLIPGTVIFVRNDHAPRPDGIDQKGDIIRVSCTKK